jgi:hypothetical protein
MEPNAISELKGRASTGGRSVIETAVPLTFRERRRESSRRWRLRHLEKSRAEARERIRLWRAAHPEETLALARESMRKWREANPEKSRGKARKWRIANPEKARAIHHRAYLANKERWTQRQRKWRMDNRSKWLEQKRSRYLRLGHTSSLRWLRRMRPELPYCCAIGGGPAEHADHLWPLSFGGPPDDPSNLRYLCARHNTMRGPHRGVLITDRQLRAVPCSGMGVT